MIKRRTYTKEFKIEAVELADKIDNSAQAERNLGIPHGQIYKWRKKLIQEVRRREKVIRIFPNKASA